MNVTNFVYIFCNKFFFLFYHHGNNYIWTANLLHNVTGRLLRTAQELNFQRSFWLKLQHFSMIISTTVEVFESKQSFLGLFFRRQIVQYGQSARRVPCRHSAFVDGAWSITHEEAKIETLHKIPHICGGAKFGQKNNSETYDNLSIWDYWC